MNMIVDQVKIDCVFNERANQTKSSPATLSPNSDFAHLSLDDSDEIKTISDTAAIDHKLFYSFVLYDALIDICANNVKYFECDDTETGQRYLGAFRGLIDHVGVAKTHVSQIVQFAPEYDFDEHTPANGYRSFVKTVQACINHSLKVSKYIAQNRSYLLFRKNLYVKEIEACYHLLGSLCSCTEQLMIIRSASEYGSLFPSGEHKAEGLFNTSANVNQYSFYGRCLGFHYCESMQTVLKFLGICLAGFSEAYYRGGGRFAKATSSMWTSGKYFWNPELRARRIVNLSQNAGIDFCQSFWSLTEGELMSTLPNVFGVKVKVNKLVTIPPEPLQIQREGGTADELVDIPIPSSHLGPGPVTARLLSHVRREGMIGERNKRHTYPASKHLIFHCHGGGFVAQSSKSHEVYLREWAARLHAPILSIDYSLAPQAPYPRALEEVFYAYCWALKNRQLLGTTAERVVVVGDSAGANLNMALTLKCIDHKIRRPDGVFLIYCPVKMSFDPSPARLLCLMDPLLPFGFLMRCLKAYVHPGKDQLLPMNGKPDKHDKRRMSKLINSATSSTSTTSAVIVVMSDSESEMPTFVHVGSDQCDDYEQGNVRDTDNSASADESSVWEHIEHDPDAFDDNKSPGSDGTSDTFASASLRNSHTGGNDEHTEMMTPDESNGISFEEDSQPITLHKPNTEAVDSTAKHVRNSTSSSLVDMDSTDHKNESIKYVADFVDRYALDENGVRIPVLKSVPRSQSEENILLDEGREAIHLQNIPQKIYKAVETAASTVANTFTSIATPAPIKNGLPIPSNNNLSTNSSKFSHSRLNSVVERNPIDEFQFEIPHDPFMSPYYASDEVLKQLPPVKILSVDMDPCLDDCIMMAKKLKSLGNVVGLDVLSGLPHGFLSFIKLSKEAYEGNRVCIDRLAELLESSVEHPC